MPPNERTPTDVDRIAEEWVDTLVELDPAVGTYIGRTDRPTSGCADYSPAGHERAIDGDHGDPGGAARRRRRSTTSTAVTVADLGSELALDLESDDAGCTCATST